MTNRKILTPRADVGIEERKWREAVSILLNRLAKRIDLRLPSPVVYFGSETEDNSWRIMADATYLYIQRRISGTWTTIQRFGPVA